MTNPSCPLMDSWACGLVPGAGSCLWLWGATRQSFPVMWHCIKLLFKLFTIMLCSTTQQPYHHIRDLIWWYDGLQAKFNILPYTFHRHQTRSICNVWLRKMDPMTFEIAWNFFHNWVILIGNYSQNNCCFLDIFKHFHNLQNIVFVRKTEYRISWTPFKMFYLSLCFPSFFFPCTALQSWEAGLTCYDSCVLANKGKQTSPGQQSFSVSKTHTI